MNGKRIRGRGQTRGSSRTLLFGTATALSVVTASAAYMQAAFVGYITGGAFTGQTQLSLSGMQGKALIDPSSLRRAGTSPSLTRTRPLRSTPLSMIAKSGGREILTTEQFYAEVVSPDLTARPILVFYSAPWCGPCRLSNPVVRDVMKEFAGKIDVMEVCTDDLPDVASEAGVVSIPTIQLFYEGEVLDTIVGCVAKNVLASAVVKVLEEAVEVNVAEDADVKDE